MNPFLKAGILTAVVVALSFLMMSQLDNARTHELSRNMNTILQENQAREVIYHYGNVMAKNSGEQCPYLKALWQKQLDKTYALAVKIHDYELKNVFNQDYQELKGGYFLSLSDIYITSFENRKVCGMEEYPLAFFYSEKTSCPECWAQNEMMGKIAARCKNVRIYAFPSDFDSQPVKLFVDRYNIRATPSMVANDEVLLQGLQSEEAIISTLKETGADCT